MAWWSIFTKTSKSRVSIALDVGTSTVRSLLIEKNADGVFGFKKQTHLIPRATGDEKFIRVVGENLRDIIYRYLKGQGRVPKRLILGLGSRLAETTMSAIPKERADRKKLVNEDELAEMVNKYIAEYKEKIIDGHTFVLTHAEPLRIRVDGYDFNLKRGPSVAGKNIELWAALTFTRKDFANELIALRRTWGGLPIDICSTPVITAARIAERNAENDFLLVKIGGKGTELALIEGGLIQWTSSLPVGGDDATQELASRLNTTLGHAEDIKRQFGKLILPQELAGETERILKSHSKNIADAISQLLNKKEILMPPTVLLYGGGARTPFIEVAMRDKRNFSDLTFADKISVKILQAEEMTKDDFKNQTLRGPEDVDLAALALTLIATNK